jgi:hypothetical protein
MVKDSINLSIGRTATFRVQHLPGDVREAVRGREDSPGAEQRPATERLLLAVEDKPHLQQANSVKY